MSRNCVRTFLADAGSTLLVRITRTLTVVSTWMAACWTSTRRCTRIWSGSGSPGAFRPQGLCIFIGTPKGRNNFYTLYEMAKEPNDWFTASL
jgi:hypothetical protein